MEPGSLASLHRHASHGDVKRGQDRPQEDCPKEVGGKSQPGLTGSTPTFPVHETALEDIHSWEEAQGRKADRDQQAHPHGHILPFDC